MLTPLSWLKEFVDIKIPVDKLAERLSSAGLTVEKYTKDGTDYILDPEITPNRPDWMSVYGVAREISALTNAKLKPIKTPTIKPGKCEVNIKNNFELCPRYTAIVIKNVTVKSSPEWLQKRLKQVNQRAISNLVDITNYVMWELGNPLHVFDLDKIRGKSMTMEEARGGEEFKSLDGLDYKLPKGSIIFKDLGRVVDLCGLKGGDNSAISSSTKNILIHVPIYEPVRIRKTSQALGLRSDASAIFERGADPGNTINTLNRAVELVLELAGGKIEGGYIDEKVKDFEPWKVELSHEKLEKVLGIKVEKKRVDEILESLGLKKSIPTYRNDIHIEEDLIEEIGRVIGYDNFPKTLPQSAVPTIPIAYKHDYDFDYEIKQTLKGAGYSEIYTYSLVSEDQLKKLDIDPEKTLKLINPISKEYEYLRPTLLGNLLDAYKQNQANFSDIKLYEFGKQYTGPSVDKAKEELIIFGILSGEKFYEAKGIVEKITNTEIQPAKTLNPWLHPGRQAENIGEVHPSLLAKWGIKNHVTVWAIDVSRLKKSKIIYQPISKFPPIIEDMTVEIKSTYGETVDIIKKHSLVSDVKLIDTHENNYTFRITYLNPKENLTDKEVAIVREKIAKDLKI